MPVTCPLPLSRGVYKPLISCHSFQLITGSSSSHDAIVAIASVSSIGLCISTSVLFIIVGVVCMKLRSPTTPTTEYQINDEPSIGHMYETIVPVPKTVMNLEDESMDKNIAYGPIYAVCK